MAKIRGFEIDIFVNENGCVSLRQPRTLDTDDDVVQIGRGQLGEVIDELTRLKNLPDEWHIVEDEPAKK